MGEKQGVCRSETSLGTAWAKSGFVVSAIQIKEPWPLTSPTPMGYDELNNDQEEPEKQHGGTVPVPTPWFHF